MTGRLEAFFRFLDGLGRRAAVRLPAPVHGRDRGDDLAGGRDGPSERARDRDRRRPRARGGRRRRRGRLDAADEPVRVGAVQGAGARGSLGLRAEVEVAQLRAGRGEGLRRRRGAHAGPRARHRSVRGGAGPRLPQPADRGRSRLRRRPPARELHRARVRLRAPARAVERPLDPGPPRRVSHRPQDDAAKDCEYDGPLHIVRSFSRRSIVQTRATSGSRPLSPRRPSRTRRPEAGWSRSCQRRR